MSFVKRIPSTEVKCLLFSETFIAVNDEQSENALSPIVATLSGMAIEVKEEHSRNALSSIVVTLSGMMMEVKEEHFQNAHFPIVVIPSLITALSICSLIEDQGVVGVKMNSFLLSQHSRFDYFLKTVGCKYSIHNLSSFLSL